MFAKKFTERKEQERNVDENIKEFKLNINKRRIYVYK